MVYTWSCWIEFISTWIIQIKKRLLQKFLWKVFRNLEYVTVSRKFLKYQILSNIFGHWCNNFDSNEPKTNELIKIYIYRNTRFGDFDLKNMDTVEICLFTNFCKSLFQERLYDVLRVLNDFKSVLRLLQVCWK